MTMAETRRRRLPVGATYVLLCTGLAVLVTQGIAPTWSFFALLLLLLPFSIVGFALVVNGLVLADEAFSSAGALAFVVLVAVLAWLQTRIFRVVARNWRARPAG
jgi:hypothetical protein